MGGLSMDQLLGVDINADLSEEQLDVLYSGLDELDEDAADEADNNQLKQLFLRAQYMMRSKQAQLLVAVEEIEKLAEAAGENEELKQRNVDLQKLVNKFKAKDADSRGVDLRAELEELQAARAQLRKDVKAKQRQLDDEKRENDKLGSRVEELESERRELRRQLDQLNDTLEGMRPDYDSRSDPEEAGEHQYAELLRQKNQYINVLLDDVESHDREKSELRSELASLREQLAEAGRQMETMAAEFDQFRRQSRPPVAAVHTGGGGEPAGGPVSRLQAELAELRAVKARRDAQFDQLSAVVEQRTDQFKQVITARDAQIETLQAELRRAADRQGPVSAGADSGQRDRRRLSELERLCDQQRRQLAGQAADLRRATADMEAVTARLEAGAAPADPDTGDRRSGQQGSLLAVRAELGRSEAERRRLEEQLENTELQAADYNTQVTELTARLREVLEGEFGLPEAVAEIKEAQRQVAVRDRQVAEQNSRLNLVQRHLTELVDENSALRSRLGLEPHEAAELVAGGGGREKLVHVLEREIEKLEEERIALKLENRKLSRQLRSEGQSGLSPAEIRDICRQRREFWEYVRRLGPAAAPAAPSDPLPAERPSAELLERLSTLQTQLTEATSENQRLRAGFQEILDSVRQQDGVSAVKLAAPSLEALLTALDTRSLTGDHHPALVPYSALQQLQGRNEELRDQLRDARAECRGLSALPAGGGGPAEPQLSLPAHLSASSSQLIGQLTAQLTATLKASEEAGRDSERTRSELEALRGRFLVLRHQTGLLYEQRAAETEQWRRERAELEIARQEAETESQAVRAQLRELEAAPADRQPSELHRRLAVSAARLVRAERRLRLAAGERRSLTDRLAAAESELRAAQWAAAAAAAALRADRDTLQFRVNVLQRQLENSAPLDKLTEVNDKVERLTDKYDTMLTNQERLVGEERVSRLLEAELALLRDRLAALETPPPPPEERPPADQTELAARLAEAAARERQQRLRAEHAESMARLLRDQLSEAERHAAELERSGSELARAGAAGRLALARLADQLTGPADSAATAAAGPGEQRLEEKLLAVEGERDRLKETLQLATSQLAFLRSQQQAAELAADAVRRELAALQDTDDLRAVIASLHQRLLEAERTEAELRARLAGSGSELEAAAARLYRAETAAAAARLQLDSQRATHSRQIRCVRLVVQQLRGCLCLPQRALQERLCHSLAELLTSRRALRDQRTAAQEAQAAVEGERAGLAAQRALLETALQQLQPPAAASCPPQQLRAWLERCQTAEMEAASLRLRCERLTAENSHWRQQLEREERRAAEADTAVCRLQNTLELRLIDQQLATVAAGQPASATPSPEQQQEQQQQQQPSPAERPSRLPVRRPAARPTLPQPKTPADRTAPEEHRAVDTELRELCEQHAAALTALLASLADRAGDVSALERRLSAALQQPAPAGPLLAAATDVIRRACDVTEAPPQPSPTGTYSIPSPTDREPGPLDAAEPAAGAAAARRRLRLAEAALSSLQQRLRHKEESCAEFRRLLAEARRQAAEQAERHRQQLARSSDQLRQQAALLASLQAERGAGQQPLSASSGPPSSAQLSRLHESSELLAEQERAIGALMERLRESRDQEARHRDRVARLESERRETAQLLQRTVSALTAERSQLQHQLEQQRSQAAVQAQSRLQAQAALIHRLGQILLKKERQHHALARVLKEVKAEIVQTVEEAAAAERQLKVADEEPRPDQPQMNTEDSGRTEPAPGLQDQLRAAHTQLDTLKGELNERTLEGHRLQAQLAEAERRRREDSQRLHRQLEAARSKLRAAQEDQNTARSASRPAAHDPGKVQEEVAKWGERKRWQRSVERLKARLTQRQTECERQQAVAAGLRDTVSRLERERAGLEAKIRTLTGLMSEERYLSLERDNQQLRERVAQLASSSEDAGQLEQLRNQLHTLTSRLAAQRAAARQAKTAAGDVSRLESQVAQMTADCRRLTEENDRLKTELAAMRRPPESGSGGGGDRPAEPEPPEEEEVSRADPATVSILRRLVERLRADNLRLRRQLLRHTVTGVTEQQVELMRSELNSAVADRDRLAAEVQRLQTRPPAPAAGL